ncbi:hypothetical protein J4558_04705 [Leptolyngbya sp. 15MV]|nr:hypothetical protein J4558_04705 [Leptolyngbya sp. 15MV]
MTDIAAGVVGAVCAGVAASSESVLVGVSARAFVLALVGAIGVIAAFNFIRDRASACHG